MENAIMERQARGVAFNLSLNTLEEIRTFCQIISHTDLVPKAYKGQADTIMIAAMMGKEIGLPFFQSLQSIAVVNGIPSIYGDSALALVRTSKLLESIDEWWEVDGQRQEASFPITSLAEEGKEIVAFCKTKRVGEEPHTTWFSVSDAKRAGLWGKSGPWAGVPQRMLMWRARGWNLRDGFGDVLRGIAFYEEAQDIESHEPVNITPAPAEVEKPKSLGATLKAKSGNVVSMEVPTINVVTATVATPSQTQAEQEAPAQEPSAAQAEEAAPTPPAEWELTAEDRDEITALIRQYEHTAKGRAILSGFRKDLKLLPHEVIPKDQGRFVFFLAALRQSQSKI